MRFRNGEVISRLRPEHVTQFNNQYARLKQEIILSNACGRLYSERLSRNGVAVSPDGDDINTMSRSAGGVYDSSSASPAAALANPTFGLGEGAGAFSLMLSLPVRKPSNYLGAPNCLPTYADKSVSRHRSA
jgi:hypothetical protein